MRLKIGDVEIEADSNEQFDFLLGKIETVRTQAKTSSQNYTPKTEGRIKRTADEKARGLSIDEARAERQARGGKQSDESGEAFSGEIDLAHVPTGDEDEQSDNDEDTIFNPA